MLSYSCKVHTRNYAAVGTDQALHIVETSDQLPKRETDFLLACKTHKRYEAVVGTDKELFTEFSDVRI